MGRQQNERIADQEDQQEQPVQENTPRSITAVKNDLAIIPVGKSVVKVESCKTEELFDSEEFKVLTKIIYVDDDGNTLLEHRYTTEKSQYILHDRLNSCGVDSIEDGGELTAEIIETACNEMIGKLLEINVQKEQNTEKGTKSTGKWFNRVQEFSNAI